MPTGDVAYKGGTGITSFSQLSGKLETMFRFFDINKVKHGVKEPECYKDYDCPSECNGCECAGPGCYILNCKGCPGRGCYYNSDCPQGHICEIERDGKFTFCRKGNR